MPQFFTVGMINGLDEDQQFELATDVNHQLLQDFKVVPYYNTRVNANYSDLGNESIYSSDTEICVLNPGSYKGLSEDSGSENRTKILGSISMGKMIEVIDIHNGYIKL